MRSVPVVLASIIALLVCAGFGRDAAAQQLLGTCCFEDGTCLATTNPNCLGPNTIWLGGCGGCQPGVCLVACCATDGSCVQLAPNQCTAIGGTSQGSLSVCAPLPACPFTLGSCCFSNGTCIVTTRILCQNNSGSAGPGVFQGDGTTGTCSNFCSAPRGACCRGAQCAFITQAECGEHPWAGPLVTCRLAGCCPADFNTSGTVTVQDIFEFLADYFAGNSPADFNHSCTLTVQDIFTYLAAYFAGCN